MKIIDYKTIGTIGTCRHMQERSTICNLTESDCVGLNIGYNNKPVTFGQGEMQRCPMYNLDFKTLLGRKLSEKIRDFRTRKNAKQEKL